MQGCIPASILTRQIGLLVAGGVLLLLLLFLHAGQTRAKVSSRPLWFRVGQSVRGHAGATKLPNKGRQGHQGKAKEAVKAAQRLSKVQQRHQGNAQEDVTVTRNSSNARQGLRSKARQLATEAAPASTAAGVHGFIAPGCKGTDDCRVDSYLHGVPKSGTTWLEFVISQTLKESCAADKRCLVESQMRPSYSYVVRKPGNGSVLWSVSFGVEAKHELCAFLDEPRFKAAIKGFVRHDFQKEEYTINLDVAQAQMDCATKLGTNFLAQDCISPTWLTVLTVLSKACTLPKQCSWMQSIRHVLVVRDPRDAAISWMYYRKSIHDLPALDPASDIDLQADARIQQYLQTLVAYPARVAQTYDFYVNYLGRFFPVLVIFYEDMLRDLGKEISRILAFYGLPAFTMAKLAQLQAVSSPDHMRQMELNHSQAFPGHIIPEHAKVRSAHAGTFATIMSLETQRKFSDVMQRTFVEPVLKSAYDF